MEDKPLKRPERRQKPELMNPDIYMGQSQPDPRTDMSREELWEWMKYQRGLVGLLEKMLETERFRLAEVIMQFGTQGQNYDPELTYTKIKEIGKLQGVATDFKTGFQQDWTWKEKILYILRYQKYPMKLKDIVRSYRFLDEEAEYVHDLNNTISVNLRVLKKSGQVIHYKQAKQRVGAYVLPEWLDSSGVLQAEFSENGTE